jgi:hypothetical protein
MRRIPKRFRRRYCITADTTFEEIERLIARTCRSDKLIAFVGESRFLMSGRFSEGSEVFAPDGACVIGSGRIDAYGSTIACKGTRYYRVRDESVDFRSVYEYARVRLAGSYRLLDNAGWFTGRSLDPHEAVLAFTNVVPVAGQHYYLEKLPVLSGGRFDVGSRAVIVSHCEIAEQLTVSAEKS